MQDTVAREALAALSNPALSLRAFGRVKDQQSKEMILFDPEKITHELQNTILDYVSDPPRTQLGQTYWLALLGYRQGGKSLTSELVCYPKAAYGQGHDHVCIADTKDRAEYLHSRVQLCHKNWPEQVRSSTISSREVRQLSFTHGGKMRVLSGEAGAVGIGQSPDSWHASECPYWTDFGGQLSLTLPSLINQDNGIVIFESTPSPMDEPSAEEWQDHCYSAKLGGNEAIGARWLYKFFPFWDGKLNQRPWPVGSEPDSEEVGLLEKYGHLGLGLQHLAFRRLMMATDKKISRNPDLFDVYYPFDDLTCWLAASKSIIHESAIERHRQGLLVPWTAKSQEGHYQVYEDPQPGALYVLGVDPIGWGARDHGAFHILKCYAGDWKQVAVFGGITDPIKLVEKVIEEGRRYNNALVGAERNGVGEGFNAMLIKLDYPNIYYDKARKPGIWKNNEDQMLSQLIGALKDELTLLDEDTVRQLGSYRNDRKIQQSLKAELLSSGRKTRRRGRHHWDKVSALAVAVITAQALPIRHKPKERQEDSKVLLFKDMTWNQLEAYKKKSYKGRDRRDSSQGPTHRRK